VLLFVKGGIHGQRKGGNTKSGHGRRGGRGEKEKKKSASPMVDLVDVRGRLVVSPGVGLRGMGIGSGHKGRTQKGNTGGVQFYGSKRSCFLGGKNHFLPLVRPAGRVDLIKSTRKEGEKGARGRPTCTECLFSHPPGGRKWVLRGGHPDSKEERWSASVGREGRREKNSTSAYESVTVVRRRRAGITGTQSVRRKLVAGGGKNGGGGSRGDAFLTFEVYSR